MIEWRPIPGWPEYEASSEGQIRRIGGEPRRPFPGEFGHLGVVLYRQGCRPSKQWVHRLVCAAFHGEPAAQDMHAAHWNGDPADNRPANLRWATPIENEADKKRHGTGNGGSRNGMARLSQADAEAIREIARGLPLSAGGKRLRKGALGPLARKFGVTTSCIRQVIAGTRWNAPNTKDKE